MDSEIASNIEMAARAEARIQVPDVNGELKHLARRARVAVYAEVCHSVGYWPWKGYIPLFSNEQIEEIIKSHHLE